MSGFSRREFFGAPALIGLWREADREITGGFVNERFRWGIESAIMPHAYPDARAEFRS